MVSIMIKKEVGGVNHKRHAALILLLSVTFVVPTSGIASAFRTFGGAWPDDSVTSLTWRWVSSGYSALEDAMEDAVDDWDGTPTEIGLSQVSSNEQISGHGYYDDDGRNGYCTMDPSFYGGYLHADVYLNWRNLEYDSTNERRGTAGHELGHAFGLAHPGSAQVLMNPYRDRSSVYTPQTDDINGINYLYPRS